MSPSKFPTHQSRNRPKSALHVFIYFIIFSFESHAVLTISCTARDADGHDEVKYLQMGQQRDQSAAAPSVPLMTTWLLCDVTRLAGEAP